LSYRNCSIFNFICSIFSTIICHSVLLIFVMFFLFPIMAYDYPFWYLQTYLPKAPSTELLIALPKNSVKGYSLVPPLEPSQFICELQASYSRTSLCQYWREQLLDFDLGNFSTFQDNIILAIISCQHYRDHYERDKHISEVLLQWLKKI
jgi:hypothetical protein